MLSNKLPLIAYLLLSAALCAATAYVTGYFLFVFLNC